MPETMPRVFISYTRSDGEAFATALRHHLQATEPEITLWQDRAEMEGGVGWWKQITEALDHVEYIVLIATPNAMCSKTVGKEWRYARQQGVCIYPVLVPCASTPPSKLPEWMRSIERPTEEIDFDLLPRWMRDVHFYHLEKEWERFVLGLKSECRVERVPFMAPDVPENFVERPAEYNQLLDHLLDRERQNPLAITTALRGAGGFGKTTLAAKLCHNEAIITAFDDGILWVTLGETPDLPAALTKLYAALTDERPGFVDTEDAAKNLSEKLTDLDCLIVIDDVWNSSHLRPFLQGGERCARLITTRNFDIALGAKADEIRVDEMTLDESVQMLLAKMPEPITGDESFRALARRLGEWPLLLELANATLRERLVRGDQLDGALAYVNKALDKRGVTAFNRRDEAERRRAIDQTIEMSLELLADDERKRCCELAIFPEDTDIPLSVIGALWGLDDFDTEELIQHLDALSLLRYTLTAGIIRLHDMIRVYLTEQVTDPAVLHGRLIAAWDDLYTLPNDYAWHYLAYHLRGAEKVDTLRSLLLDFHWLAAKLNATGIGALLGDFDFVTSDSDVMLVRSALAMSSHVLFKDKSALAHQLAGRLMHYYKTNDEIRAFWDNITPPSQSLYPILSDYAPLNPAGGMLIRILRQDGWGHGILVLRDGRILTRSNDEKTPIKLWDKDGNPLNSGFSYHGPIYGAKQLSDDRILTWGFDRDAPFSQEYTITLWDTNGNVLRSLREHQHSIKDVQELANGNIVTWAGNDTPHLWDANGNHIVALEGHKFAVSGIRELRDGRLISWGQDKTIRLWDANGQPLITMTEHTSDIYGVHELKDGRLLSWSYDKTLRLWDANGNPIRTLIGHTGGVSGVTILMDSRILSWSNDKTLRLWDTNGNPIRTLTGHTDWVSGVLEMRDGHLLSWDLDGALKLWDHTGNHMTTFVGHTKMIYGARELADGRILSWSDDKTLRLWDRSGNLLTTLAGHDRGVLNAEVLADGRILSCGADQTIRLWSTHGHTVTIHTPHTDWVTGVLELACGDFVSRSKDGTLRLWTQDGKSKHVLEGHIGPVNGACELPDGRILSWSADHNLRLWSQDGQLLKTMSGHTEVVNGALCLDDGRMLSWSADSTIRQWDGNGNLLVVMIGHLYNVTGVRVLADGRIFSRSSGSAVKGEKGNMCLWTNGGILISQLHSEYLGVRSTIDAWGAQNGLTQDELYPPYVGRVDPVLNTQYRVRSEDEKLRIYDDAQPEATISVFYTDTRLHSLATSREIIVAGDEAGRVLFLRWVE